MSVNMLVLNGSPRKKGNSATLAAALAGAAAAAGASVETLHLHGMDIRPCTACEGCKKGPCIIEDDMRGIYPRLAAADAIVLASPVYWFTYSAQLKGCVDRWYGFQATGWKELMGKRFGLVLAYGDTDLYTSGGVNAIHTVETMVRFLRGQLVGVVHGTLGDVGDAEQRPDLLKAAGELGRKLAGTGT